MDALLLRTLRCKSLKLVTKNLGNVCTFDANVTIRICIYTSRPLYQLSSRLKALKIPLVNDDVEAATKHHNEAVAYTYVN